MASGSKKSDAITHKMKLQIRDAKPSDLECLVRLHLTNYDANELSVILGKRFVRALYQLCLTDQQVRIRVLEGETGVVAMSAVFFRYKSFEKKFKYKAIPLFVISLTAMFFHFEIKKIKNILKTITTRNFRKKIRSTECYNHYVGSFIVDKKECDNPAVVLSFYKMLAENIKKLRRDSADGIWGSCRVSNQSSLRLLKDRGMKEIIRIESFPEDLFLCISK